MLGTLSHQDLCKQEGVLRFVDLMLFMLEWDDFSQKKRNYDYFPWILELS